MLSVWTSSVKSSTIFLARLNTSSVFTLNTVTYRCTLYMHKSDTVSHDYHMIYIYIISFKVVKMELVGRSERLRELGQKIVEVIFKVEALGLINEGVSGLKHGLSCLLLCLLVSHRQPTERVMVVKIHVLNEINTQQCES